MSKKGYKQSENHKEKLRISNLGKPHLSLRGKYPKNLLFLHSRKGKNHPLFGRKLLEAHRKKISEAHKGEKSHFWKGGSSKINKTERNILMNTFEYKLWRESIFIRDNYTCLWCGARNKKGDKQIILNADHIKSWKDYPELRFAIDNGRTLCVDCHIKTNNYGRKINNLLDES